MAEPAHEREALSFQRIDLWLWHARFVRTRKIAQEVAASGRLRVNGQRIAAASHRVRLGDVLTLPFGADGARIVRVAGFSQRRGAPADAAVLWEPMS